MSQYSKMSRREFIKMAGLVAASGTLAACGVNATQAPLATEAPVLATEAPPVAATTAPAVLKGGKVRIAVGGWAEQNIKDLLAVTEFTKNTGIDVEVVLRTDTKETELSRLTSAIQAGDTPYDILDFEDELTTTLSQAGYMLPLNDLISQDVWDDLSPAMKAYTDVWSTHNDEVFRMIHNWEMPYWFYRKDWFDSKSVQVPKTWDDVKALGSVFTDEGAGVWASEDGLIKGAFLNVYLAWITLQAGGNPFDVGPEYQQALEYIHDLMYTSKVLNPASLQKDYNQQNGDYLADKVAFMRQWPFFGDVARSDDNKAWFGEDKVSIALPPVGPGGAGGSTYAAGWGWGIVKNSPNLDAAKEMFKFLISQETSVAAVKVGFWFLNARKSVLAAAPADSWLVKALNTYTDANVIGVRPHHPQFVEALTILEDTAAAYLTDQISLEESMNQAKDQLATLG
jgi:ABC-type glycerol-3-phosphate transport system substrate-binding protein